MCFDFLIRDIKTGGLAFCLALLVCSSYWKAHPGEEEMESSDCSWPPLLSAGREAAGDEASSRREECVWGWSVVRCSPSPTLAPQAQGGVEGQETGHKDASGGKTLLFCPVLYSCNGLPKPHLAGKVRVTLNTASSALKHILCDDRRDQLQACRRLGILPV